MALTQAVHAMKISAPVQKAVDDRELIRRTLAGDRDAFGELAQRYEAGLFRHLRRLTGNRDDAEDIAQEALLRAYRALPTFNDDARFGPWLFRIATNLAMDLFRQRGKVRLDSADVLEELPDSRAENPADRIQAVRDAARLNRAVDNLPPLMSTVVYLHYREQMKLADIAKVLQRDAKGIAVTLHRARNRLRTMLCKGDDSREM